MHREVFGLTDVGLVREGNEDALLLLDDENLFVVADGMGGHACGEVASAFTIEAIRAFYHSADITRRVKAAHRRARPRGVESAARAESAAQGESAARGESGMRPPSGPPPGPGSDASFHGLRLRKAVESANISVYRLAQQHEQLRDMGTTVVATSFVGGRVYVANVGDSRVYRMRKGVLTQLTEDHSLLNEYIKMNLLKPEEIESFPYKNVIVRALGLQESMAVDITMSTVRPGDQILLCTDGLTDLVRDEEIRRVLAGAPTAEAACHHLTEFAKARGGHDNITTLIVRIHDGPAPVRAKAPPPPPPAVAPNARGSGSFAVGPPPPGPSPTGPAPTGPAPTGSAPED